MTRKPTPPSTNRDLDLDHDLDHDELIRRLEEDLIDSYDEEFELELEDRNVDAWAAGFGAGRPGDAADDGRASGAADARESATR